LNNIFFDCITGNKILYMTFQSPNFIKQSTRFIALLDTLYDVMNKYVGRELSMKIGILILEREGGK